MDAIIRKLEALRPQIDCILETGGSPGLSLGVLHHGTIVYTAHFGQRNTGELIPPDDNTIQSMASLTKLMTAAAIAKLVHEGVLQWDVPIREYLPAFRIRRDDVGLKASMRDLLSLRTGITPANILWGFQNSEPLMTGNESTLTATSLRTAKPFGQFVYSQWNYALIDDVVKELTGASICSYIEKNIFGPLCLNRSSFGNPKESDDNVAHTHCTHDNGTSSRKRDQSSCANASGIGAGGGARSSMHDFMIFLKVLLGEYKYQKENEVDGESTSVFPHIRSIFVPHVGFGPPQNSGMENAAYCMGMYRTRLPGLLSLASPNFYYTLGKKLLPPYGEGIAGTEVFHHAGTSLGHLGAMYLVPSTESAVVSLTNSQPLMDPTDFVAQLALSVLLEEDPVVNFVEMAKLARNITLENYKLLKKVVEKGKTNVPPTKHLLSYEGDYYNVIHSMVLSVSATDAGLTVCFQRGNTGFKLLPYDGDTFYWPVDREQEMCEKGMWGFMYKDWHLFHFEVDSNGEVGTLSWRHDPYLASPEVFRKTPKNGAYARL